jgi:hypothetical protein
MAVVSAFPQVGRRIWSGAWMLGLSRLVPVMGGLVAWILYGADEGAGDSDW